MGIVQQAGGPLRFTIFLVVGIVLFLAIVAASLWGMDYGVEATVVDKSCSAGGSTVTVQETVTRIRHTESIDDHECIFATIGHVALYNIRSERLRLYSGDGQCYWDSEGIADCFVPPGLLR